MTAEILYPVSEVAELWRCSREHVYEQIRKGRLKTVNLAKGRAKTRVPESALNAYIRSLGSDGTEPPAGPSQPTGPTGPGRKAA
jgi:excisionase family DNA binding protein